MYKLQFDISDEIKHLKKRFLESGLDSFSQFETIELALSYCVPLQEIPHLADEILKNFTDIYRLIESDPIEITYRCGVTESIAEYIYLFSQFARKYMLSKWEPKNSLDNIDAASKYAQALFTGLNREAFYLICLDINKHLIKSDCISKGTVSKIDISIRQLVEKAILNKSSYVIIAHNHPGCSIAPSQEDVETTIVIKDSLKYLEIKLIDHIIVAGPDYYSFAQKKLLGLKYNT